MQYGERPRIPKAIQKHAPGQSHDMKSPMGAEVRKNAASKQVSKDYDKSKNELAAKFVEKDRASLVNSKDVTRESGATKGKLSAEMAKAQGRERER